MRRAALSLIALWACGAGLTAGAREAAPQDAALKAAFVFNFAKFTEWPALPAAAPIIVCVSGDDSMASALTETVRGQNISGHALTVEVPRRSSEWSSCHVLYVGGSDVRRTATALQALTESPVLTVSDRKGFAQSSGLVELYVKNGRMAFAINVNAVSQAGLRISSRLLERAEIVRGPDLIIGASAGSNGKSHAR